MDQHKMYKILHLAQETYGYANQMMVVAEECSELAEALSISVRSRIVEEIADVFICLHHLYTMFNISPQEQRVAKLYSATTDTLSCIRELCGFIRVLTKYPRYNDHTSASKELRYNIIIRSAVIAHILDRLQELHAIQPEELQKHIDAKLERLERWLNTSTEFVQTTIDRDVVLWAEGKVSSKLMSCKEPNPASEPKEIASCGNCKRPELYGVGTAVCRDCLHYCNWIPKEG